MRPAKFLILSMLLTAVATARAGETRPFYRGIRGLGMGGAQAVTVNDETALLVNPAGLGKLRDHFVTVADPEVEVGSATAKAAGSDIFRLNDPQRALADALKNPGANMHERAQVFPSIALPNFGFGVFGKYEVDARFDPAANTFAYDYRNDYAAVLGLDYRLLGGVVKIGASARAVTRVEVASDALSPTATDLTLSSLDHVGYGIASDLGLILTAPTTWFPSLGVVYRDIGRTSFTLNGGLFHHTPVAPNSTPSSVDVAFSVAPIIDTRVRSVFSVEYDDATTFDRDPLRHLHVGYEVNCADMLFLRAGLNQRYWTAGFELDIINYQFQAASYGEDIGVPGHPLEDRRYAAKVAFRF